MFISCYEPETMKQIFTEAGFEMIKTATETQLENEVEIPFLWIFGRKMDPQDHPWRVSCHHSRGDPDR